MADETKLTAATRLEKLLDNIAGGENEVTPATRLEKFLSYIADAMEGGGGSGGGDSGGDLHVYEVKPIPAEDLQPGDAGFYIDGEISEILSGPCMLIADNKRYFPILYLVDSANNEYELDVLVDDSLNVVAYRNGQGYDETWPYNDKLAYIFDGSPIG